MNIVNCAKLEQEQHQFKCDKVELEHRSVKEMKIKLSTLGIIFLVNSGCIMTNSKTDDIAEKIKTKYESQLYTLVPYTQRHYALRMFRLSGNEQYLYPIITDMMTIANLLNQDVKGLSDTDYRKQRELIILNRFNLTKEKQKRRYQLLKQYPQLAFSFAQLANINMVHEVGLLNSDFFPNTDLTLDFLKQQDFSPFFLNPEVVEIYSPQLATYIFFLSDLGIVDLQERFIREFQKVFMEINDKDLSKMLYAQKLYGLTHFIIGASRNYQKTVNRKDYSWIYEYFENNIDSIISRAKPDIVAEVGIAFLLAGEYDHPVVKKTREAITKSFNNQFKMIPSTLGGADLTHGEHRNVLAIMLLTWPDKLHPGPNLKTTSQYQNFWLKNYLP